MNLPPEVGQAGVRLCAFFLMMALITLTVLRPSTGSAAFVMTVAIGVFSAVVLVAMLSFLGIINRRHNVKHPEEENDHS